MKEFSLVFTCLFLDISINHGRKELGDVQEIMMEVEETEAEDLYLKASQRKKVSHKITHIQFTVLDSLTENLSLYHLEQ